MTISEILNTKLKKKERQGYEALQRFQAEPVVLDREFSKVLGMVRGFNVPEIPYDDNREFRHLGDMFELDYETYRKRFDAVIPLGSFIYFSSRGNAASIEKYIDGTEELLNHWKKAPTVIKQRLQDVITVLKAFRPLAEEIDAIGAKSKTTREIREQKEKEEIIGRLNPVIVKAVDEISADFERVIRQNYLGFFKRVIDNFLKLSKEKGTKDIYKLYEGNDREWPLRLTKDGEPLSNEKLEQKAAYMAKMEVDGFRFKMLQKFAGLLSGVAVPIRYSKHGKLSENRLHFYINGDESFFTVENSVVFAHSKLGTPFYRYPTTFHDAKVKGKAVKSPDEFAVKKALNDAYNATGYIHLNKR